MVGEATGRCLAACGNQVGFVDVEDGTIARLRRDGFPAVRPAGMKLVGVELVLVSVPTPATADGIDAGCLRAACRDIGRALREADDGVSWPVWTGGSGSATTRSTCGRAARRPTSADRRW